MKVQTKLDIQPSPVRQLAKECYDATNGDWNKAAALMRRRIEKNEELFKELMQPLIDQACWAAIRSVCHHERAAFVSSISRTGIDDASGLRAIVETEIKRWLDYPLSSGIKLGDADREKLETEAEMHARFASANARKAAFFEAIAKRIDGKTVREALSETQLENLWEKVS